MSSPFSTSPIESGGGGAGVTGLISADGGNAIGDNEIIRGDGTTGIQGSTVTMDDSGNINAGAGVLTSGNFPGSSTDNAVARYDSTTGKLIQSSDLTIADVAGASVAVATTTGNALTIAATAPAATTGASQVGKSVGVTATDAVASTDTAGAAAGGAITLTGGAAARNASGNADGGAINLTPGAGIGSGLPGAVNIGTGTGSLRFQVANNRTHVLVQGSTNLEGFSTGNVRVGTSTYSLSTNPTTYLGSDYIGLYHATLPNIRFTRANNAENSHDAGVNSPAAGLIRISNGTTGMGAATALRYVLPEITSPETVATTDSRKLITNTGAAGAVTYNLPAAAIGLEYYFVVVADEDMVIDADGTDTIRIAGSVSGAGGTATNGTTGGSLHLVCVAAGSWYAVDAPNGTWTLSA